MRTAFCAEYYLVKYLGVGAHGIVEPLRGSVFFIATDVIGGYSYSIPSGLFCFKVCCWFVNKSQEYFVVVRFRLMLNTLQFHL